MLASRMLSAALVCLTINLWHAAGAYAQTAAPVATAAPLAPATPVAAPTTSLAPAATPGATVTPAATSTSGATSTPAAGAPAVPPDSGEIGILKAQIAALDKVMEQMQKVDSKIANMAPWIALAIAIVTCFVAIMPILFFSYEIWIRRANEKKFDDYKVDLRGEIGQQMNMMKNEIAGSIENRMDQRLDHIITAELRKITQNIEGDYSKNLAQVETACYCLIQNEFRNKWDAGGPGAIEQMHIFRYLLIHLVGGDRKERLNALHRLTNEYVDLCGPTTRNSLATLLGSLETDIRFTRRELSGALRELKERCLRPPPVAAGS